VRVEVRQDDRQELGWQELQPLNQMRLRHGRGGRGWRRQEEIAQPVGNGKTLGSLFVAEAPHGDLAVRGHGAQSGERGVGGHFGAKETKTFTKTFFSYNAPSETKHCCFFFCFFFFF